MTPWLSSFRAPEAIILMLSSIDFTSLGDANLSMISETVHTKPWYEQQRGQWYYDFCNRSGHPFIVKSGRVYGEAEVASFCLGE